MTHSCEMMWLKTLMAELGFLDTGTMPMHCGNQTAIYIANNPVFHQWTKHIKVDCHFMWDNVMRDDLHSVHSIRALGKYFTKVVSSKVFFF